MNAKLRWGALAGAIALFGSASAFAQTGAELDALFLQRDQAGMSDKNVAAVESALKVTPESYDILWRAARWHCWMADTWVQKSNPLREPEAKQCWDLGAAAVKVKPEGVEGNYWAASGVGQWSEEVGIVKALTQGLEGVFNGFCDKSIRLDAAYHNCDPLVLKGRYFYSLPWPKRDLGKSAETLQRGIAACPTRVRLYVFLADTQLKDGDAKAAKETLEKGKAVPMGDDPPETRRALRRADEAMKRVEQELKMIAPADVASGAALKVRSLVDLFEERVRTSGSQRAAMHKTGGAWRDVTWAELATRVHNLANGLVARGIQPGDRVSIFAATLFDWCVADLAIVSTGAVTVPIYASNTTDECYFILNDAGCKAIVVDGEAGEKGAKGRLTRILEAREKLPGLQLVITTDPKDASAEKKVVAMSDIEKEGEAYGKDKPQALAERATGITPEQAACFIYTSGTTGSPKGVVLTHRAWVYEAQAVAEVGLMTPGEVVLLFLPMAHSFGKVIASVWLGLGFTLAFCENPDRLMEYLPEIKPTVLPAVPRIFEKVYGGVIQKALAAPGMKGKLAAWAMKEFDAYAAARAKGEEYSSLGFSLAKALVFKKIAQTLSDRLGGRVRLFISGSAPLAKKIAYFLDLNGLLILEGYGLTETSAASTVNRPTKNKIGTVGAPFPGTEVKLAEDGEILFKGPGVMKEYFNNPKETEEAFNAEGWFKTGDIGEIDADGYVRITDRKKDLIKTSGGKYVAPQFLENVLKTSQIISQVMIHGDRRKYITALVTVNEDVAKKLFTEKGQPVPAYAEMGKNADVQAEIQKAFDALNATLPSYETVKKFRVLETDLTLEAGDLTPTLKVKRKVVTLKYMKQLDSMYDEPLE